MDLKVGETYVMKEAEISSSGGLVYLKKGAKVRLKSIGGSRVIVQDLSEEKLTDGIWSTYASNLMTPAEALKATEDVQEEPKSTFKTGAIYIMTQNEVSPRGRIYVKKGARVRIEAVGVESMLVQDLSEDREDDGIWIVATASLVPLVDALKVGEVYTMAQAETNADGSVTFLKKGAKVRLKIFGMERVIVEDLTDTKRGDGVWYTNPEYLLPIEEPQEEPNQTLEEEVEAKNQHYITTHQPIEVMQANMTHDELIGFLKGNIIKYACRCGRKDEPLKEAEKIKQYAEWLCVVLSGGTIDPRS